MNKKCMLMTSAVVIAMAGCGAEDPMMTEAEVDDAGIAEASSAQVTPDTPSASEVYIEDITAQGTGCQTEDTVTSVISLDRKSFIVIFTAMQLLNPPGPAIKFKNCLASVRLHVPQGWQVSLATVNTRGFASLANDIRARQSSAYFFAGNPITTQAHSELVGPFEDDYIFTDDVPFASRTWSACGRSEIFAVDTRIFLNALRNPQGSALFNTTNIDGAFKQVFHVEWRPCR